MLSKSLAVGDLVYVIDWGKSYNDFIKFEDNIRIKIFPWKTEIPDYSGIHHHVEFLKEPNLTLKGTVNKREPWKHKGKIYKYKNYKYEVVEIIDHPKKGQLMYPNNPRYSEFKYSEDKIVLIRSTHTEVDFLKCYVQIEETGLSYLTPEQYGNEKFNAFIEANLKKHDRNTINRSKVREELKEIISTIYDMNDNVLFGSMMTKGKVSYDYLDGKYSVDGKHIYLGSSCLYDGKGNEDLPKDAVVMKFADIKKMLD